MIKKIAGLVLMTLFIQCKEKEKESKEESAMDETTEVSPQSEGNEEWTILFDGSNFNSWKGYLKEEVPDTWKLEDGTMVFYPPENKPAGESYNIVTKKDYNSFVLSLDWKISPAGNSGIFWAVVEDEQFSEAYQTGPEIQVLDNAGHPDASAGGGTHTAGSLYDMVAPSEDATKPAGEWNSCVLTVDYNTNKGSVVLNDVLIVEFEPSGDVWDGMIAKSKFADWPGFAKTQTGKIGLQDHGDIVAYRNIKIKEL
ncbi:MAG: DUF1080 domain-containing protein [Flavobacteriaceae bacterium]|nr:DUF1080 domain-containing protein [Flavobacteriaceae bacterium]MDH3795335.1 DUF1080 domain-containing protein [Flavobacteriaceae bacterium]